MDHSLDALRNDARSIWQAGVDAVRSEQLVASEVQREGRDFTVCGHRFIGDRLGRIAVVGAGKAGAGMAAGVESALGADLVDEKLVGWVNVPADCVRPLQKIHLHAARPAGVNEPTAEGVAGSERILQIVDDLSQHDLCLVLLSGGGSALLPAPNPSLTLADKLAVTRYLMKSGATIEELNTVRKRLSRIKGGGLARASRAGQMMSLIISDIVGDPIDMIASGPTCPDRTTDTDALHVLKKYQAFPPAVSLSVIEFLERSARQGSLPTSWPDNVVNTIIGNNATALEAAASEAGSRGYHVLSLGSENCGEANQEGRALAARCRALREDSVHGRRLCLLSGGEPVVHLAQTDRPRRGGRNQQLVLAALDALNDTRLDGLLLLSGGTDGEDGPTDAAGAWIDAGIREAARREEIEPRPYLEINNAYAFFERVGGLLKTGPTHTNVMDLRVALIRVN